MRDQPQNSQIDWITIVFVLNMIVLGIIGVTRPSNAALVLSWLGIVALLLRMNPVEVRLPALAAWIGISIVGYSVLIRGVTNLNELLSASPLEIIGWMLFFSAVAYLVYRGAFESAASTSKSDEEFRSEKRKS